MEPFTWVMEIPFACLKEIMCIVVGTLHTTTSLSRNGLSQCTCILHNNRFFKRCHIYMSDAIYVDRIDTKKVTLLFYSTDVVLLI
jgi:hypothetical protein